MANGGRFERTPKEEEQDSGSQPADINLDSMMVFLLSVGGAAKILGAVLESMLAAMGATSTHAVSTTGRGQGGKVCLNFLCIWITRALNSKHVSESRQCTCTRVHRW